MQHFEYEDLLAVPFVDGGRSLETGLDCWGLVLVCFERAGIILPDYQIGCFEAVSIDAKIAEQRPFWVPVSAKTVPALVVMRFNQVTLYNHTGVTLGGGRFLHTDAKKGVHVDRIDHPWWKRHIDGFYVPGRDAACRIS